MKVYIVNLDKDVDRLKAAAAQLDSLNVPFERLSAVYAKEMPRREVEAAVNRFRWWCAVGRPFRLGEVGCALSHFRAWERCEDFICVLEDDVIVDERFPEALSEIEKWMSPRVPQVVLLSNHSAEVGNGICASVGDMYTEGYVITRAAAEILRACNSPLQTPCDWWGRWARRGKIELYHYFPTVCAQDQSQYESSVATPGCFRVSELGPVAYALHKGKRLLGKLIDCMLPL